MHAHVRHINFCTPCCEHRESLCAEMEDHRNHGYQKNKKAYKNEYVFICHLQSRSSFAERRSIISLSADLTLVLADTEKTSFSRSSDVTTLAKRTFQNSSISPSNLQHTRDDTLKAKFVLALD